jgi:hypothetical protein
MVRKPEVSQKLRKPFRKLKHDVPGKRAVGFESLSLRHAVWTAEKFWPLSF